MDKIVQAFLDHLLVERGLSANTISASVSYTHLSIEKDFQFILEDLTIISLGGKDVVVVLVNMITDRGEEYLTGSAIVKQDIWRAVVNATLASVNRRISIIS